VSTANISAIIWDYDGTLVDTRYKNLNEIFSIGACYDPGTDPAAWNVRPDFEAHRVEDILEIVDKIKSFQLNQPVNNSTNQLPG